MSRSKTSLVPGLQATKAVALTPSDTDSINTSTSGTVDAVFLTAYTTAGTASVIPANSTTGTAVTIYLALGQVHPLLVRHIRSSGTTAAGITGVWS